MRTYVRYPNIVQGSDRDVNAIRAARNCRAVMTMTTLASGTAAPIGPDSREFVASLARGLTVISAFGQQAPAMTLSEVAARTGITRAAARRFLLTLAALGYVAFDGKLFQLTPKVLGLGYAYLSSMSLWEVAQPFLEEVATAVHESCSISVLDGEEIVYVARVPTSRIMSVGLSIGTRLPAHCTSMGRVLLAALTPAELDRFLATAALRPFTARTITAKDRLRRALARIGQDGFGLVDQELEDGLLSIAVPLRNRAGKVLAAMNASGHASRVTATQMIDRFLPPLRAAADQIRAALAK